MPAGGAPSLTELLAPSKQPPWRLKLQWTQGVTLPLGRGLLCREMLRVGGVCTANPQQALFPEPALLVLLGNAALRGEIEFQEGRVGILGSNFCDRLYSTVGRSRLCSTAFGVHGEKVKE